MRFTIIFLVLALSACTGSAPISPAADPSMTPDAFPSGDSARGSFTKIRNVAVAESYGYGPTTAIRVGGGRAQGSRNEHLYLKALRGPDGQAIRYQHKGWCCPVTPVGAERGQALLDMFEITWDNAPRPVTLYLDVFHDEELLVPTGFTPRV